MKYTLLISGQRSTFTTLAFDANAKQLTIFGDYPSPFNASWVEPTSSQGSVSTFIGVSEDDESGLLYTFEIDHARKSCRITSEGPTLGAPAHFVVLGDGSGVALAAYMGDAIALYPISYSDKDGMLLQDVLPTECCPSFPYNAVGHGPNKTRQRQCHVHQIIEDRRGLLYAPDLGSDRVWILRRNALNAEICGWLQCPSGSGPRHAALTLEENTIYVLGELSHTVIAFDISSFQDGIVEPIDNFNPSVIPPSVDPRYQTIMDPAEICIHPQIPNVLYVSNRLERHIVYEEADRKDPPAGDSIAIILLSDDGKRVERVKHVQTGLDVIRGMRISPDGKYMVAVGQAAGGVEVYGIGGVRGDEWALVAALNEGLERGIKHAVWL